MAQENSMNWETTAGSSTSAGRIPLEDIIRQFQNKIAQLESGLTEAMQAPRSPPQTEERSAGGPASQTPLVRRPTYPDVEPFSGENLKSYDPFRLNLETKLLMDESYFSTDDKKVLYAFGRLTGKASQRMLPWMEASKEGGTRTFDNFKKELDRAFGDPDRKQQALVRLHRMKQGRKDLREFLGEFNQVLAEAGAITWSSEQKKGFLEAAVSVEILQALIGNPTLGGEDSYETYCETLLRVDHQQKRLKGANKPRALAYDRTRLTRAAPSADPDAMDWEPTTAQIAALQAEVAALRTNDALKRRARWVPDSEIRDRRARGACYRCGQKGHLAGACQFLPAQKPTTAQVMHVGTEANAADQDQEDSGKE